MNKTKITKMIAKNVVGMSVGFTVSNVIASNVHITKTHHKVMVYVGAMVVGSMVAKKAEQHVDEQIDAIIELWTDVSTQVETDKK